MKTDLSEPGKIFAGLYALYAGLVVVAAAGIPLGPGVHHLMHHVHRDEPPEAEQALHDSRAPAPQGMIVGRGETNMAGIKSFLVGIVLGLGFRGARWRSACLVSAFLSPGRTLLRVHANG